MTHTAGADIETLRSAVTGEVLGPDDPGYDDARSVWNGQIDHRPAVIARCASAGDVGAAIGFARAHGLEISVRGGGHNFGGAAVSDGGLMIDLSRLNRVTVDPATRIAVCGGGATLADLDAATQEHGLAVPAGTISHTGVGGLTLGGGFGWLTSRCGLACDNLSAAWVVTADGEHVRAAPDEHPDLFWALRGGGGNFGVVTDFEFTLHPVGPLVQMGLFFWPFDAASEALRVCRDTVAALPRGVGAMIACLNAPSAPFVPDEHRLRPGVVLIVADFGTADDHARVIAPVRDALAPLFEFVTPMPYTALQHMLDQSAPWGILGYEKALYLDELSDPVIAIMAEHFPRKHALMSFVPIFSLGGAFAAVGEDDTAFGGPRTARYAFNITALAETPELLAADRGWVRSFWEALVPHAIGTGGYVNFMTEYERDRVRQAYGPAKYARLAAVKSRYDPDNIFHLNANIAPAT